MSKFFPEHPRKDKEFNGHVVMYWNTQRYYGPKGQRMIAVKNGDSVLFFDLTRNIEGVLGDCAFNEYDIMNGYDKNQYEFFATEDEYQIKNNLLYGDKKMEDLFG